LTPEGELPPDPSHGNPNQVLEQSLRIQLNKFRGENPLDQFDGLPFREMLDQRDVNEAFIEQAFREQILSVNQVIEIREFIFEYERSTRTVSIEGRLIAEGIPNSAVEFNAEVSFKVDDAQNAGYLIVNVAGIST
jgi:hypothetical protein